MITLQQVDAILADQTKRIDGDIRWRPAPDHAPAMTFRVPVASEPDWPLTVTGWWNPKAGKLNYTLRPPRERRIYALNMGAEHTNPTEGSRPKERVGNVHKHRWTEEFMDEWAYEPDDITAPWDQPVEVWRQFCAEANITHLGTLTPPQGRLVA